MLSRGGDLPATIVLTGPGALGAQGVRRCWGAEGREWAQCAACPSTLSTSPRGPPPLKCGVGAGPPAPAQEAPNCPVLIACFSPAAGWGLPWAWSLLLEGN